MKNIKVVLKTILSLGLMFFLFFKIDLYQIQKLSLNSIFYGAIGIVITLCSLFVMAIRWYKITEVQSIKTKLIVLYKLYLEGMFYNIFLPGAIGGDVVRVKKLTYYYNVTIKKASLIALIERLSGLYMLFVIFSLGLFFVQLPEKVYEYVNKELLQLFLLLAVLVLPLLKKIIQKKVNISYQQILLVLILSLLAQMGDVFIAKLFCSSFDVKITFSQLLVVMPFVYFATVIPISLGGLGVREGVFVGVLALFGVNTSVAVMISFLMYLVKVMVGVLGWGVSFLNHIKAQEV